MNRIKQLLLVATALVSASSALAADLRIGLQDDADVLDPHRARTFVGCRERAIEVVHS